MKRFFPIALFLAVALGSLAMAGFAYVAAQEAARFKFEATADDALNRISSRIDLNLALLRATHAMFVSRHNAVSAKDFQAYFAGLDVGRNFAGLRGIGLARLIRPGQERDVEAEIARQHGIAAEIHPASNLHWRAPVVLFEPLASDRTRLGFDIYTDPVRRAAVEIAMSTGEPRATGLVQFDAVGGKPASPGFNIYARLDGGGAAVGGRAGSEPVGFLYASFRTTALFETALGQAPLLPVNTEIYDGSAVPENLLFRSEAPPARSYGEHLTITRETEVAGRLWTIRFRPTAAFTAPTSRAVPLMLGVFGLLLAGAVALVARYQNRAYSAAATLHEATQKSLAERDLMLQEMKHRIKNSIARVLAIARQTAANSPDLQEFSSSFSARLQAMAASQDMLTRSRWQKADLRELLRIELGQVFGKELNEEMLTGPEVLLSERATQALGLTFHELATNALKYGEQAGLGARVDVCWLLQESEGERTLVLNWSERGQAVEAPARVGFGTRLIDMNITRELNGAISRDYRSDGLLIVIRIPLPGEGRNMQDG